MKLLVLAGDEVLRLLTTKRGLLSIVGFVFVWAAVLIYGIVPAARFYRDASESGILDLLLPDFQTFYSQLWPTPELTIFWMVSLYLLPLLAILTAADQTASDRARGTLRYLVLRCSRLEIFFGRYLGQLVVLLSVILITLGSVLAIVAVNSSQHLVAATARIPVIVVNLMLVLAPYIALMALVSVLARTARQATLFAVIIWLAVSLLVSYLQSVFPHLSFLDWVLPGSQVGHLRSLSDWQMLALAPIPLVHTAVLLGVGAFFMWRRDL